MNDQPSLDHDPTTTTGPPDPETALPKALNAQIVIGAAAFSILAGLVLWRVLIGEPSPIDHIAPGIRLLREWLQFAPLFGG